MNGEDDIGYQVELFVYDLSKGIAKTMSPALLGKEIEGIWHTGVVAYGREYFFGSGGIESCRPGGTILGDPDRVEELGESQVPYQLFLEYIFGLGEATYKPGTYDLFKHNCNNFSDEVSQFLCGRGIPKHILQLPDEVLNTPLGETLSSVVKDLDIKSSGSRKINFANYNNNVHTFVPGEYGRQRQQQQQQHQGRSDSPDLELERLNQAIDQVRQNTLRLEDRRNSINEKVNKHDKKKKEKREKRDKKEKKEKKKKKKSRSTCDVPEGVNGDPTTSTSTSTPSTNPKPPLSKPPLPPATPPSTTREEQGSRSQTPSKIQVPEVTVTPAKEGGGGGGREGGGGGTEVEKEERKSPQPATDPQTLPQTTEGETSSQIATDEKTAVIDTNSDSQASSQPNTDAQTDAHPSTDASKAPQPSTDIPAQTEDTATETNEASQGNTDTQTDSQTTTESATPSQTTTDSATPSQTTDATQSTSTPQTDTISPQQSTTDAPASPQPSTDAPAPPQPSTDTPAPPQTTTAPSNGHTNALTPLESIEEEQAAQEVEREEVEENRMADQEIPEVVEGVEGVEPEPEPQGTSPPPPAEPEVEREPPITFRDYLDAREEFECLVGVLGNMLTPEEQAHLEELRAYVLDDEGSWALGENFSSLLGRVFHDGNVPDEARVHLVRVMAAAALKDDVILLLHQDRRDHTIMNYANRVEFLSPDQQEALALFFCNMFEHVSPSEWLLYISEWQDGSQATSNIRVTTKIAVNALLNTNPKCQEYGSAIMYNLGTKEVKTVVFDDVAPELAMAILQFFSTHPPEELLWRTMAALCRFTYSSTEVPALIKMIGPEPSTFRGASERVDALVEEIDAKLSRVRAF
ncbi:uncharacterized protein DDB_G0284459-like isoform X3 [Scylla paramamosain]